MNRKQLNEKCADFTEKRHQHLQSMIDSLAEMIGLTKERFELYLSMAEAFTKERQELMQTKGKDYAGNENALANFDIMGAFADLTPFQIALIFKLKGIMAICNYAFCDSLESESIEQRLFDDGNYNDLMWVLYQKEKYRPGAPCATEECEGWSGMYAAPGHCVQEKDGCKGYSSIMKEI
jgi:hypothetical protein